MKFREFLEKETPSEGGCMLCLGKYKDTYNITKEVDEYLLIERHKVINGDLFTINTNYYTEYEQIWDEKNPWKILYKREL